MELRMRLDVWDCRSLWQHNLCIYPLCLRNRVQRVSSPVKERENKFLGSPFTKYPKAQEGRVLSHAQPTDDDTVILSLNTKPDRKLHVEEAAGSGEVNDGDYLDLSVCPNHRSGYVAVIGKPNVGKSTLLNQMLGQKLSIVTDKPQTTRHRILGLCSAPNYQMVLYDTPGVIQKKMHKLDAMMMTNVRTAAINADCILIVIDVCKVPEKVDDVMEGGTSNVKEKPPMLLVLNKKDLIKPGEISKRIEWYEKFGGADHVLPVSAKYGDGVEDVKSWIISKLPYGPAYYPKDIISEHPERFFVAELVREKIFMQYRQEIPYACQVNVVNYISRLTSKHFIEIEIVVEKEAQKIILIGKEGKALKLLATAARLDIEEFLQKQVYLEECIDRKALTMGKQIHDHMIKAGLRPNIFVGNNVINMYAMCGGPVDVCQLFDKMPKRDLVS